MASGQQDAHASIAGLAKSRLCFDTGGDAFQIWEARLDAARINLGCLLLLLPPRGFFARTWMACLNQRLATHQRVGQQQGQKLGKDAGLGALELR